MATKSKKRVPVTEENSSPVPKKARITARKGKKVDLTAEKPLTRRQTSKIPATTTESTQNGKPKPVGRSRVQSPSSSPVPPGRRRLGVSGRGTTVKAPTSHTGTSGTMSQVVKKIRDIIIEDNKKEEDEEKSSHNRDYHEDEDDRPSSNPPVPYQEEMQGPDDYTVTKVVHGEDGTLLDPEENGQQALDLSCASAATKMIMVEQDTSVYDDPTKTHDQWWAEDKTREPTLIDLWREHTALYNFRSKNHMTVREDRPTILRKFAMILKVPPHIIETRMSSLRNQYQRMYREGRSGSGGPIGNTARQKEILDVMSFLRDHIKTGSSITNYGSGRQSSSSAGTSTSTGVKKEASHVSTPKKARFYQEEEDDPLDLSEIDRGEEDPNYDFFVRRQGTETDNPESDSDDGASSSDEFVQSERHFSRNDRLHTELGVDASRRRSPRLSPLNTSKKTTDRSLVKSGRGRKKLLPPTDDDTLDSSPKKVPKSPKKKPTLSKPKATTPAKKPNPPAQKSLVGTKKSPVKRSKKDTPYEETAAGRKAAWLEKIRREQEDKAEAEERKAEEVNRKIAAAKAAQKHGTTAAQRKAAMLTPEERASMRSQEVLDNDENYGVEVGVPWNLQQGSSFRKQQDTKKKTSQKDTQEKALELMKEKNEALHKMTVALTAGPPPPSAACGDKISPEQLWADSLVPQIRRIPEDIRDEFLLYVQALTLKAIRGKWPEDN